MVLVQRLDDCRWVHGNPKVQQGNSLAFFWGGGWAWVICIWSRLLHNGACLLLITAFYEPRSREKPDSTLAFQSFLGLKKQCILHDFIHCQGANWKHIKWFFANGICTLRLCWQAQALHTCMNKWIHSNTNLEMETPYVFLYLFVLLLVVCWNKNFRIVHSLSINDLKSSNWTRF